MDGGLCKRRLIISNFRVGSWYLHDEIVNGTPAHEGLGEISWDFYEDRTTKVNNWLTKTNDIVGKFQPIQWEGGNHRQVIEFADVIFYLQREVQLLTESAASSYKEKANG